MSIKVAIAGNPNSGKTTLFNRLTGSNAHVGNWPGVTVELKEGKYKKIKGEDMEVVDLPGIYSLSPYSPEEVVARNYILDSAPDVIINIVDATNLERNLYFTSQLLEIGRPMVIALNMMDILEKKGDNLDIVKLEKYLGAPVIPISASTNKGVDALMEKALEVHKSGRKPRSFLEDSPIAPYITKTMSLLEGCVPPGDKLFYAIKLLEGDSRAIEKTGIDIDSLVPIDDGEALVADLRYKYIGKHLSPLLKRGRPVEDITLSDKIDKIATHKILGIPVFLLFMSIVFHTAFSENFLFLGVESPGIWLQGIMDDFLGVFSHGAEQLLISVNTPSWAQGLIVDGVFAGIGSVLSFLPQILVLFLFLSIMEDSGYMARAAFVMDKLLLGLGLSGKSFMPMILGFGCSVPAIMAARTLERERDRVMTIMLIPFMSCGAKLSIHLMIAGTFFPEKTGIVIFWVYITGIITAVVSGLALKNTLFKDADASFLLELPPYRLPSLKSLGVHLWEKARGFIVKAGTVLMASVIIIWFLSNFNSRLQMLPAPNSPDSILCHIAGAIRFIFAPLGFADDWRSVAAILTGLAAKEAVVSTMSQLYAGDVALFTAFSPAAALSFLAYNLLTVPCFAAVSTLSKELNSKRYFLYAIGLQLCASWIVAFAVWHGARLILN